MEKGVELGPSREEAFLQKKFELGEVEGRYREKISQRKWLLDTDFLKQMLKTYVLTGLVAKLTFSSF